jgi:CRISPR-associated protein (TIGR02584 family)
MDPASFPRRVLLSVVGLSPQVVTETVYALARSGRESCVPTEILLITTAEGASRARLALLSDEPGWFQRLRHDYALPPIAFDAGSISVVAASDGSPLDDIRTPEDNLSAADRITERVRELTADPDCALHVSIAGGRKTMGYYAGYALSLFGRPQDRLSHVLVSEPFESSWEFFYPTPYSRVIQVPKDRLADTADARVTLAEIPFVSLRSELPRALLDGRATFAGTVAAAREALGTPELVLDPERRCVAFGGRVFVLPPSEFALLAVLAHRARSRAEPLRAPLKDVADRDWALAYLKDLRAACGSTEITELLEDRLRQDTDNDCRSQRSSLTRPHRGQRRPRADNDYLSQHLSRLRRQLTHRLDVAAVALRIEGGRGRGYRLAVPPEAIRFAPLPPSAQD